MIEREDLPSDNDEVPGQEDEALNNVNPLSLEEQEQRNSENLVRRIEEENREAPDYGDTNETIDEPSQGEEDLSGFLERSIPADERVHPVGTDNPVSRNLAGDNPPGSEQAAFEAGTGGDMGSDQAAYDAGNIAENFQENIDKTESEQKLDKKLRDDRTDN